MKKSMLTLGITLLAIAACTRPESREPMRTPSAMDTARIDTTGMLRDTIRHDTMMAPSSQPTPPR